VARVKGDGFEGRYVHFDGYPAGVGAELWRLLHGPRFHDDVAALTAYLIDEHQSGWSSVGEECYCHGRGSQKGARGHEWLVTSQNASGSGCEYAYAFNEQTRMLFVLSSYCRDGSKMIGMFGMGDEDAVWRVLASVDLDGPEPDWGAMDVD
jgi:hypothetical protein